MCHNLIHRLLVLLTLTHIVAIAKSTVRYKHWGVPLRFRTRREACHNLIHRLLVLLVRPTCIWGALGVSILVPMQMKSARHGSSLDARRKPVWSNCALGEAAPGYACGECGSVRGGACASEASGRTTHSNPTAQHTLPAHHITAQSIVSIAPFPLRR